MFLCSPCAAVGDEASSLEWHVRRASAKQAWPATPCSWCGRRRGLAGRVRGKPAAAICVTASLIISPAHLPSQPTTPPYLHAHQAHQFTTFSLRPAGIAAEYATEVDARGNGALARLIGALVAVAITPLLVVTFVVPWLAHGGVPWASTFSTFVETAATAISSALTMQWYLPLCEEGDMVRARVSEGLMRRVLQQPNAPTA